jgi:hypothetical protein
MGSENLQTMLAQIVLRRHVNFIILLESDSMVTRSVGGNGLPFATSNSSRPVVSTVYRPRFANFLIYTSQKLEDVCIRTTCTVGLTI